MNERIVGDDLIFGATDEASAYVVDDYPYGFRLRCKIRSSPRFDRPGSVLGLRVDSLSEQIARLASSRFPTYRLRRAVGFRVVAVHLARRSER